MKEEVIKEKAGHKTATGAERFLKKATDLNRAYNYFNIKAGVKHRPYFFSRGKSFTPHIKTVDNKPLVF